ncbi:hypothetical protein DSO57_1020296 [Entomophthora muscae]|uniref:Uncharacterized protein n=1 Tax=Entomophthora muscae TaxID=34485 RepID=A0ACC2RUS5_9FUNG|nr:hypothetical protein DSO57_1020296 [Entomophthora muscae]
MGGDFRVKELELKVRFKRKQRNPDLRQEGIKDPRLISGLRLPLKEKQVPNAVWWGQEDALSVISPPAAVRNIPDINQILTEGKCWEKIGKSPIKEAKFNEEFPPLFGENKNQNLEKTDFPGKRNNLASGQAPATLRQPPARPAGFRLPTPSPSGPTASSQAPCPSQSEAIISDSQSKKYLATGETARDKILPPEEGRNNISDFKNKFATNQSGASSLVTWTRPNSIQNNVPDPKITSEEDLTPNLHLAPGQHETIGSSQVFLNQPQIAGEQEFDHLPKPQLPFLLSKLLGSPIPCFFLPIENLCTGKRTINKGSHLTCLGIGGYQSGPELFGPSPEGLGQDSYYDPGQLNSSQTGPWPPLVSPHSTLTIAMYTSMYYILTYFAGSFGRYNVYAKIFRWLMTVYPIVTALTGFQFANLLPYVLQVIPTITGYYSCFPVEPDPAITFFICNFLALQQIKN